ncbi:molybdenum cofactor guanylyltransferase MobA [Brenneria goodwinii]|uniref:Molybdenum cofactor guanylyltransferase n=1 Tax=Brenneria goodwinii TaxID=1109412 RepID=A0A0G4JTQ6_9GAMM|nr:molybdenum cofactor guanylyltransferase MobA [Brenneria goodwinii]MCG8155858.1 molybdenum cofactor guanylyltransferase MobA [Brenneria goodwinii]MCG8162251.1 molybdenum cofactor guanylyltransferase MobA [Brenneria goodwinii]MCG8167028.1 molybdenum cofactor guanylyltransferase MobA [Brenneria goodwinii]MCG8169702.1 molybdenum cofactor guanylyltransferase MobA [Brenneria goodwinii]MCG8174692.1 molybdenum cofactor guanylyltransferase MobA [Brenneria goodwinii]
MITGVILAGGQATRMGGGDKGLLKLNGLPLYQHVLSRLRKQVDEVIINANRNISVYQQSGCRVISDLQNGFSGPLAGILTGLSTVTSEWLVFVPCDVPNLPQDLVTRLWKGRKEKYAAYATDGKREHPTLLLINRRLMKPLEDYLSHGDRKLMIFMEQIGATAVSFADQPEAFRNLNFPEDLSRLQRQHHES